MVKIKNIKLKNFKSFKKGEIIVHPGLTIIVGPNGSGKSNIVDAISFVLGISSLKTIRAERLSDLVFHGASSGEVTIELDTGKEIYKITREIDKKGNSIYRINGKRTTRANILSLLHSFSIRPDGHNIVMQGDVTRIIKMTPMQRRTIIDEISGIAEYEEKKQMALKELEKVNEKIKEVKIIVSERSGRLKELERERNEALKFQSLREEYKNLRGSFLTKVLEHEKQKVGDYRKLLEEKEKELTEAQNKLSSLKSEMERVESEFKKISDEIYKSGETSVLEIRKKMEALKVQIHYSEEKLTKLKEELRKVTNETQMTGFEIEDNTTKLRELEDRIEKYLLQEKELKQRAENIENEIRKAGDENILKELEAINQRIEEIKEKISSLNPESLKERILLKKGLLNEKLREKKEHEQKIKEIEKSLETSEDPGEEITKTDHELIRTDSELYQLRKKYDRLLEKEYALRPQVKSVKNELVEKLKDHVSGIIGTVGELCDYDEKHAKAIETSAGSRLNYVVTETTDDAIRALEFLKSNKLGKLTFIPLDRVKEKKFQNVPGTLGPLINYVRYPARLKSVFETVFENTYLVDSIHKAKDIKHVRLVSLDGDISEPSGTLSGGYSEFKSIRLLLKQLEEIEKEKEEIRERIESLETKKKNLQEKLRILQEKKAEFLALRRNANELIDKSRTRIIELERVINQISGEISALETQLKTSQDTKASLEKELLGLLEKRRELRERLKTLENISGLRNSLDELRKELVEIREKILSLNSQKEFLEKEIARAEKRKDELESKKQEITKEISETEKTLGEMKTELQKLDIKERELSVKLGELGRKRDELDKRRSELAFKIANTENRINRLKEEKNQLNVEIARCETKISDLEEELKKMGKFTLIEGDAEELKKKLDEVESELNRYTYVNLKAIEVYDQEKEVLENIKEKLEKLEEERNSVLKMIEEIEARKTRAFMDCFEKLNLYFNEYYARFYPEGGSKAYLKLQDPKDPLNTGVLLFAQPPGKKPKNIDALSGGEKTITALAFLFAVQAYNPSPFYVLDEVEAALDRENTERVAKMLKEFSKKIQLIVITHNNLTAKYGDQIIGIYMGSDGSSMIHTDLKQYKEIKV